MFTLQSPNKPSKQAKEESKTQKQNIQQKQKILRKMINLKG